MGAIKDLWESERGVVALALVIAVTVMLGLARVSAEQWIDYTKWIFVTYAAAKTVTGVVAVAKGPSGPQTSTSAGGPA